MNKMYSNKWYIIIFLLPALILFCGEKKERAAEYE